MRENDTDSNFAMKSGIIAVESEQFAAFTENPDAARRQRDEADDIAFSPLPGAGNAAQRSGSPDVRLTVSRICLTACWHHGEPNSRASTIVSAGAPATSEKRRSSSNLSATTRDTLLNGELSPSGCNAGGIVTTETAFIMKIRAKARSASDSR